MLCCSHSKLGHDDSFGLFCVFDGHNGVAAAQHIHDTLVEVRLHAMTVESMRSLAGQGPLPRLPITACIPWHIRPYSEGRFGPMSRPWSALVLSKLTVLACKVLTHEACLCYIYIYVMAHGNECGIHV